MSTDNLTQMLKWASLGDEKARESAWNLVHAELYRIAEQKLGARNHGTVHATALVDDVYLRFFGDTPRRWNDRKHFFRSAGCAMRNILLDHAKKRRPEHDITQLEPVLSLLTKTDAVDAEALAHALDEFAKEPAHDRALEIIDERFFLGMEIDAIAALHGISRTAVRDDISYATAWLKRELMRRSRR